MTSHECPTCGRDDFAHERDMKAHHTIAHGERLLDYQNPGECPTCGEIFVEKRRSLFQRARARDYYDVYRLLEQESFDDGEVVTILREKCRAHDVDIDLAQGLSADGVEAVQKYWKQALDRLVTEQLPFETVVERIDTYLQQLATVDG